MMFTPWRGDDWGMGDNMLGGIRLLVLGESHHSASHEVGSIHPEMTQDCVNLYLTGSLHPRSKAFFTKLTQLISGTSKAELGADGVARLWHAIAFYNYVPRIAAEGARNDPFKPEWAEEAAHKFAEVVKTLEVEAILVLGARLWWNVPQGSERSFQIGAERHQVPGRVYPVVGIYRAVAAPINHPSSVGWTASRWRPVVNALFAQVSVERQRIDHLLGRSVA